MGKFASCLFALSLLMCGCTTETAKDKAKDKAATAIPPQVLVVAATSQTMTDFEEFTGHTEAKNMVEVKARVTGYLDKVFFKDGDTVKEGDPLFEIDPRPYQVENQRAEAQVAQAETKQKRIEADYQRALTLKQTKAISPEEFDKIKGDRGEADSAVKVARANREKTLLDLKFTKVVVPNLDNGGEADPKNPRTGRVSRRMKDPGNLIKADDTSLTTIVTLNPMQVYFDVDERTILALRTQIQTKKIKSINEMTFRFELASDDGKFPYHGKIDFEDNKLDTGTGTLQLRGEFDNTVGLSPGLFVRLRLYTGSPRKVVLIPERALGTDQDQKFVYIVKQETDMEGNPAFKAEYRGRKELKLGALVRDDWRVIEKGAEPGEPVSWRVIEKGIEAGERVIWSGLQRVRKDGNIAPKDKDPSESKKP